MKCIALSLILQQASIVCTKYALDPKSKLDPKKVETCKILAKKDFPFKDTETSICIDRNNGDWAKGLFR